MGIRRKSLCVVSPCWNEAEVIETFYVELKSVLMALQDMDYTIIFVDDGSTDSTLERLNSLATRDERVKVYSLSRNFGHQIALTAGIQAASADAIVMMDSDLQHPPSLIPEMVSLWAKGYDVVIAVRRRTADASLIKRITSACFYRLINLLSETPIVPGAADFCLLSRVAHEALKNMPERNRFLRGMVSWIGFKRALVPYDAPPRAAGRSKYTLRRMLSLALNGVFAFSAEPLRLSSRLGLVIVLLGLAYTGYILGRYALFGDLVKGWSSVICSILVIGGLQLLSIGLLGEYLARVFDEVKQRPICLFRQEPPPAQQRTINTQSSE
jgi:dolichol-phosphate mannosyltransferase